MTFAYAIKYVPLILLIVCLCSCSDTAGGHRQDALPVGAGISWPESIPEEPPVEESAPEPYTEPAPEPPVEPVAEPAAVPDTPPSVTAEPPDISEGIMFRGELLLPPDEYPGAPELYKPVLDVYYLAKVLSDRYSIFSSGIENKKYIRDAYESTYNFLKT